MIALRPLLILAPTLVATCSQAADIVAHRGASADAPENTLAAVRLAWEQGAAAVEVDVTLSKDGRLVVLHDATTERLAGRDRAVSDQSFAELRQLDVGAWKGERFRGERIPLLSEVLSTVPSGRRLFVELKCGAEALPALGRTLAADESHSARVVIIGFRRSVMAKAKAALPLVPVYWISRKPPAGGRGPDPVGDGLIADAVAAGLDGLSLQAWESVDARFIDKARAAGLAVYVWTVDDAAEAMRFEAAGVDGITTNRPKLLRRMLGTGV